MEQFESMFDDTGSVLDSRVCVFIKDVDENGNFGNYQISKIITTEYAGLLFVINESDLGNLNDYKISYEYGKPTLVEKDIPTENAE